VKLALVLPSANAEPSSRLDAMQEHTAQLVHPLREQAELTMFSEARGISPFGDGADVLSMVDFDAKGFDRVLFMMGDDPACAFMLSTLARVGGIVRLFDWGLGRVARGRWPEIERPGLRGYLRALRVGGFVGARTRLDGEPPLNRPVIRLADGFIVPTLAMREQILVERNMPTPIATVDDELLESEQSQLGQKLVEMLDRFPAHLAVRKTLIQSAIEGADQARAERAAKGKD
jgi:hypothetical protein